MQLLPDPPTNAGAIATVDAGAIVQLGERLLCKQEVAGSIPAGSTSPRAWPTPWKEAARGCDVEIVLSWPQGHQRAIFRSHGEHEAVLLFNNLENSLF